MSNTAKKAPAKKAASRPVAPAGAQTGPPADADAEAFSETLLAELADDATVAGIPAMLDLHQINRRRRAEVMAKIAELAPTMDQLEQLKETSDTTVETLAAAGPMMGFIADVEDLLVLLALDADAMRAWALTADDRQLLAAFAKFVGSFSRGEAKGSSS